jgi:multiple sugar transport system substrate-binding protein
VALLPGAAFVGSQNLVIWQHTPNPADAVALAQYLMQPEVQAEHALKLNLMPARLDLLSSGRCAEPPRSIAARAAITGRTFPTMPLLGLVEDKFSMTLGQIWEEIGARPNEALGAIIRDHLLPLARQLNLTLGH